MGPPPAADLGGRLMALSFGSVLQAHAAARGADPAGADPGEVLSWAELDACSAAGARRLIDLGVQPDDMVAIALANGALHHVWSFAAWRAGATPCIVPTRLPGRELAQVLELASPRVLV